VKRFGLLHNEELDVYRSAGVVRVVKCGRVGWAEYVARMGSQGMSRELFWGISWRTSTSRTRWKDES
jgi:hypothetical protein